MNYLNIVEASEHEMMLVQMGAKVEQINSKMCYVRFMVDDIPVEFVYNINKKDKFFLERIKPYPLPVRSFEKESDIIEVIRVDIKQFQLAVQSAHIETFVNINKELNSVIKRFEDLFLYYNVHSKTADAIKKKIQEINDEITNAKNTSERVFFEKEPEHLK